MVRMDRTSPVRFSPHALPLTHGHLRLPKPPYELFNAALLP